MFVDRDEVYVGDELSIQNYAKTKFIRPVCTRVDVLQ